MQILLIVVGTALIIAVLLAVRRRPIEQAIHRFQRSRADLSVLRSLVEHDPARAGEFRADARRHLDAIEKAIKRLSRKAAEGDRDAKAAVAVLADIRDAIHADVDWSRQFLQPTNGAA